MTELTIKIDVPEDLKEEIEELNLDLSNLVKEIVVSKVFEMHLSRSKALQRAIFESLVAKSRLTEENAIELSNEVNLGMIDELKKKFPN